MSKEKRLSAQKDPSLPLSRQVFSLSIFHAGVHSGRCVRAYMCICMWRPEVNVGNNSELFFHFIHWFRVSQPKTELGSMTSLISKFVLGISDLRLELYIYVGGLTSSASINVGSGHAGSSLHTHMAITVTTEPSPQSLIKCFRVWDLHFLCYPFNKWI